MSKKQKKTSKKKAAGKELTDKDLDRAAGGLTGNIPTQLGNLADGGSTGVKK